MNKYDIMNDVIPPLTADQMATRGYAKGGGVARLLNQLFDPIDESIWVKKLQEILKEKTEPIKRYLPDWMHTPTALSKHKEGKFDYHPGNINKELLFDEDFGRYYENVPYNEYDAFADMLEGMIYEKTGPAPHGIDAYEDVIKNLRDQLDEVKRYDMMRQHSPMYSEDVAMYSQPQRGKLKKSLELIKSILGENEVKTLNSRGGLHGYAKGGRIGEYFIREPVKKVGRFLKDNVPPVFSKFAEYLPKITGKVEKYSAQLNPETKKWDIGTTSGDKKIKVEGKFVKNPDYFKATETGFKDQTTANKQLKRLQKQQVATVTKADKTEGALVWKSRESIADAPFQIAPKKQWLDYLLSRGVGYKELSDTSLFLTKAGKDEVGKDIRIPEGGFLNIDSNARISKADFLKEFDEIVPKIKVHLLGTRNFSDGLKYILDSTTPSSKKTAEKNYSGRIVYRDDDDAIKYYMDYPRANFDVKFEGLLKQVQTLVNRLKEAGPNINIKQEEGTEAFDEKMVENVVERINAAFKGQYGVDDVIGRGVNQLNHPNLPFEVVKLGNSLADVFSKRGVQYNVRGQPRHTGDQILEGGYNQNELFFSFEPGKMRTGEVGEFKPSHDFNLGEDAKGGFVHTRISDRIDEAGRKILFIEEIQSDMHQAVQNRGANYKPRSDRETTSSVATRIKNLKDLNKTLVEEMKQNTKTLEKVMASETRGQTPQGLQIRQSKIEELQALRSSQLEENKQQKAAIEELQKRLKVGTIPEGPFKNSKDYGKFVLKYLLKMARENGYDGVGMSNAWIKTRNPSEVAPGGKVYEGHFGFYGNWGLPDPSVPASFKDSIMKDAFGEVARDSKTKLALTAIKDHEIGKTWGDIPVLLLTKGRNKEIIKEAAERIDKGQSAYYKGGLIREIFKDVVPTL